MNLTVGDMSEHRQITIMIQKQMEFHRTFGLPEFGPIKEAGAKFNDRGVQTEQFVLEPEPAFDEIQLPASNTPGN